MKRFKFFAERRQFSGAVALYAAFDAPGGGQAALLPPHVQTMAEGERSEPFLELGHTGAQSLMDELWNAGIRPSEGSGSTGQLAATERHLADMRRLAFHALKVSDAG